VEIIKLAVPVVLPPLEYSLKLTTAEVAVVRAALDRMRSYGKLDSAVSDVARDAAQVLWHQLVRTTTDATFIDYISQEALKAIK
jgi:hypothetical protein